jgi:hypothetical protein
MELERKEPQKCKMEKRGNGKWENWKWEAEKLNWEKKQKVGMLIISG